MSLLMKRILMLFTVFFIAFLGNQEVMAFEMAMPIDIVINNEFMETDVEPVLINDRTYLPLRAVCNAFGITDISWNSEERKAVVVDGQTVLEFTIDSNAYVIDGVPVEKERPPLIVGDRTMVPVRFFSELFGVQVDWDPTYYIVTLASDTRLFDKGCIDTRFYSVGEMKTMSKLVTKEAGNLSYEGMHGVASVMMNRVNNPLFKNTINGVIFDTDYSVQFPPAHQQGFEETVPYQNCVLATKRVIRGENSVGPCLYFNTSPFKGLTIYKVVDGEYFCY